MLNSLILLHGALATKAQFASLKSLLDTDYDVHVLDFSGHGDNRAASPFTMDQFVQDVLDYMSKNNLNKANFFGYSMGGYVALNLALNHPERVNKIMTLGTKFNWTKDAAEKESRMLDPEKIEEKVPQFAAHLAEVHKANNWNDVLRKTAEMMVGLGNGTALDSLQLKNITPAVLICTGSNDRMVSIEESREAASKITNGKFKELDGFRHEFERNDVQVLVDEIKRFIF